MSKYAFVIPVLLVIVAASVARCGVEETKTEARHSGWPNKAVETQTRLWDGVDLNEGDETPDPTDEPAVRAAEAKKLADAQLLQSRHSDAVAAERSANVHRRTARVLMLMLMCMLCAYSLLTLGRVFYAATTEFRVGLAVIVLVGLGATMYGWFVNEWTAYSATEAGFYRLVLDGGGECFADLADERTWQSDGRVRMFWVFEISMLGVLAMASMLIKTDAAGLSTIKERLGTLRHLLYLLAAMLVVAVINYNTLYAWMSAPLRSMLQGAEEAVPASVKAIEGTAYALVLLKGAGNAALLFIVYAPCVLWLKSEAREACANLPEAEAGTKLVEEGFSEKLTSLLPRVLVVLAPLLSKPLATLLETVLPGA